MPEPIVIDKEESPQPLNVVGEHITVLASGAQTGSYEIFRQAGPEGGAVHRPTVIHGMKRSM